MSAPRRAVRTVWRRDSGSAAVELAAAVPVVILVMAAVLQAVAVISASSAANQAARDGARAVSLGGSATVAVDDSLPEGIDDARVVLRGDGSVEVQVDAVRVVPFVPTFTVTRSAVMP